MNVFKYNILTSNCFYCTILRAIAQSLEFFTDNGDLSYLVDMLKQDPLAKRHVQLNSALVEVIEDFPFVGYHTLDIQSKESVMRLLHAIDKSNGYVYANMDANKVTYEALVGKPEKDPRWTLQVEERYVKRRGT